MRKGHQEAEQPIWSRIFKRGFSQIVKGYTRALYWVVAQKVWMVLTAVLTLVLTVLLYVSAPKGFFPKEDIGLLTVNIDTPQDRSYQGRPAVAKQLDQTIKQDPAVAVILAKVDHDTTQLVLTLKAQAQCPAMAQVIQNLRVKTHYLLGITIFFPLYRIFAWAVESQKALINIPCSRLILIQNCR